MVSELKRKFQICKDGPGDTQEALGASPLIHAPVLCPRCLFLVTLLEVSLDGNEFLFFLVLILGILRVKMAREQIVAPREMFCQGCLWASMFYSQEHQ